MGRDMPRGGGPRGRAFRRSVNDERSEFRPPIVRPSVSAAISAPLHSATDVLAPLPPPLRSVRVTGVPPVKAGVNVNRMSALADVNTVDVGKDAVSKDASLLSRRNVQLAASVPRRPRANIAAQQDKEKAVTSPENVPSPKFRSVPPTNVSMPCANVVPSFLRSVPLPEPNRKGLKCDAVSGDKVASSLGFTRLPEQTHPVSVPAPAISFLRPSPRGRPRSVIPDSNISSLNGFGNQAPSTPPPPSVVTPPVPSKPPKPPAPSKPKLSTVGVASNQLVKQIHEVEGSITSVERALSRLRAARSRRIMSSNSHAPFFQTSGGHDVLSTMHTYASMAMAIASTTESCNGHKQAKPSVHPMHAALRLVMSQNQSKAASANAVFRSLCSDTERGLDATVPPAVLPMTEPSDAILAMVADVVKQNHVKALEKRRKLSKEYRTLRESWRKNLKAFRDKRSKEKREAQKERDRLLLLSTKGHTALLTSRTSSGRTSTKVIPSVYSNGQMNGTAELDSLLAEIEAEGGTPGLKSIWSKTLAKVPNQDASRVPFDCSSVLMADPVAEYHAARSVNSWCFEERLVFLDRYIMYPKNFQKIATFLEHKSCRDCSFFYYMNKIDLGLKQLVKESSALKRKGTLIEHLVALAKKHLPWPHRDANGDSYTVSIRNSVAAAISEKFGMYTTTSRDQTTTMPGTPSSAGGKPSQGTNKREKNATPVKRSVRILSESRTLDFSVIDRKAFWQAIENYGTDWRQIAATMALPGKSLTFYRDFYRKNKRKLDIGDDNTRPKMTVARSPHSTVRHSPRASHKASPKPLSNATRGKRSEEAPKEKDQGPEFQENGIELNNLGSKRRKDVASLSPVLSSSDRKEPEEQEPSGAVRVESDSKKARPTATWTAEEGIQFRSLYKLHGRDWKTIAQIMAPKTANQIKGYWKFTTEVDHHGRSIDNPRAGKVDKKRIKRAYNDISDRQSPSSPSEDQRNTASKGERHGDEFRSLESYKKRKTELSQKKDVGGMPNGKTSPKVASDNSKKNIEDDGVAVQNSGDKEGDQVAKGAQGLLVHKEGKQEIPSIPKLPMLRSCPAPILRSVPAPVSAPVPQASSVGSPPGEGGHKSSVASSVTRQNELRRAAEEYGVLELLGNRLTESTNAEKKPSDLPK